MKRRGIYPWYSPTLWGIVVYFEVNWYWVDVVLNCTMRFKWVSQSSIATKLVDLLYPREAFWRVTDFKLRGTVKLFLPHPLHAMFVPLFELPAENNKHPNFVWRGGGRVVHSFVLWNDPIWVQSLNNYCRRLLTQFPVVSWCCARIRSPNEVFQKGFKRHWIKPTQGSHSLQKSLNFRRCPWKVLEFFLALNVVAWKEFFLCFLVVQDGI